jgi:predicted DNA-binding transcriptional regulator YafY
MAQTKKPLTRYKILDKLFRSRFKKYTTEELLKNLNNELFELYGNSDFCIQKRQLMQDISFMKSESGWSIEFTEEYEGKKRIYRYADPDFSISNSPLNEKEVIEFQSAIQVLSQFEGMPQFTGIQEIVAKLKTDLKDKTNERPFIGFDSNQDLKGIEFFSQLYNAVQNKNPLEVTYKDFKSEEPYTFTFHPHYLKQYNNRWFIFGLHPETGKQDRNVAIDRIISLANSNIKFIATTIDWQDYFSDLIGVSRPEHANIEEIVLHFDQLTGKYMENKSIHETQKHKWINESTLEVKIKVIVNYELERLILSYAECVKVIEPLHLKEKIQSRLSKALV